MLERIIASGFGGQGVMLLGQIIAYTSIKAGMKATWLPSYGPEMRGGTANCSVVVTSTEVGSPVIEEPTILIGMNQPSVDKFAPSLVEGGLMILNQSLTEEYTERHDVEIIEVPANEIAKKIGNSKVINMVMVGAFIAKRPIITIDEAIASIKDKIGDNKPEIIELNRKAIEMGYNTVKEKYGL